MQILIKPVLDGSSKFKEINQDHTEKTKIKKTMTIDTQSISQG